jgi:hypothetical protein
MVAQTEPNRVSYGFPYAGYNDAVPRHLVDAHEMAEDSRDWLLDNNERKLVRRKGSTNLAINIAEIAAATASFRCVQLAELRARALSEGLQPPIPGGLWHDEDNGTTPYAQYLFYRPQTVTAHRICDQFAAGGTSSYPQNTKPWAYTSGTLTNRRMNSITARARHAAGSRNYISVGEDLIFGCFKGPYPQRWDKQWTQAPATSFRRDRLGPLGQRPPGWMPKITVPAAIATADVSVPFLGQDLFYISCLFKNRDGSFSPPVIPRPPSTILGHAGLGTNIGVEYSPIAVGGLGLIRLDTNANKANKFPYLTWLDIPVGGPDVTDVYLLRTPAVDGSSAGALPDIKDLRIAAVVKNGTKSYVDSLGHGGLRVDPNIIRFDHIAPPCSRYLFQFDQRIGAAYCAFNQGAIYICCLGAASPDNTFNDTDDSTIVEVGTTAVYVEVNQATGFVNLYSRTIATNATARAQITIGTKTVQDIVDEINGRAYAFAGIGPNYERWGAQLVPGADGSALATTLVDTTTGGFGDDFTTSAGSTPASTALTPQRVWGSSWMGLLLYDTTAKPKLREYVYYTGGGPTHAPNAANSWYLTNFRKPPTDCGESMGCVGLLDGALAPYTKGLCVIRNKFNGKTGADEDYRMEVLNQNRRCISPALAAAAGCGIYLSEDGLFACGFNQYGNLEELCISPTLFRRTVDTTRGILAYEIGECMKAAAVDNAAYYFSVMVENNQIWITFRSSAAVTQPDMQLCMDFSPGQAQVGLAALIDPVTGKPWGWSSPFITRVASTAGISAMGAVRDTDGLHFYGARDWHSGATYSTEGRIEEFNTGTTDNGTTAETDAVVAPVVFHKTDQPLGPRMKLRALELMPKYKKNGTGVSVALARSRNAHLANPSYFKAIALDSTGTSPFEDPVKQPTVEARSLGNVIETKFTDDGSTSDRPELWGLEVTFEAVDIHT